MMRTPMVSAAQNAISTDVRLVIGEDGKAKGTADVTGTGGFAVALRGLLQNAPPAFDTQYASGQLARAGLYRQRHGHAQRLARSRRAAPSFSVTFETGNWLTLPGPGAFRLPSGLFAAANLRALSLGLLNSPPQKVDRRCIADPLRGEADAGAAAGARRRVCRSMRPSRTGSRGTRHATHSTVARSQPRGHSRCRSLTSPARRRTARRCAKRPRRCVGTSRPRCCTESRQLQRMRR